MITKYAPQYKNFAEPSGEVHGAYGKRFLQYFDALISQLKIEGNRRCVISLYESSDLMHPQAKDIPCTLNWQFIVEENMLCMIANMRSNDVWLGMPYDIYVNTLIQRVVASHLGLECGWYQHQVMNIHLYERDWKKVEDMSSYNVDVRPLFVKDTLTTLDMIQWAQFIEMNGGDFDTGYASPLIYDVLSCITGKNFKNEVLENAYIRRHRPSRKDNASSQTSEAVKDDLPAHWSSP